MREAAFLRLGDSMATSAQLTTWIAALEIARQEFLVNGIAEYYMEQTRVRYYSVDEVSLALAGYRSELAALTRGGSVTYARFGGTSSS